MGNEFGRVIHQIPGLVWTALPDGSADYVNTRWCEYTGLSFSEACGIWQARTHTARRQRTPHAPGGKRSNAARSSCSLKGLNSTSTAPFCRSLARTLRSS
jgi:hypothetical protein